MIILFVCRLFISLYLIRHWKGFLLELKYLCKMYTYFVGLSLLLCLVVVSVSLGFDLGQVSLVLQLGHLLLLLLLHDHSVVLNLSNLGHLLRLWGTQEKMTTQLPVR